MIVITGGAGFIGSNIAAALETKGATGLVICDRLGTDDKWRNIAKREVAALFGPAEIWDFLADHAADVEKVIHMGAISATTESDADLIAATNFTYSQKLWAWCGEHDVALVYASSAATYGDGNCGFDDDGSAEGLARLRPLNPYGWSKHAFDRWVARQVADGARRPPQWAGLKFFNVYGPNEYHKGDMRSVVCRLHPEIAGGAPARLFKSHRPDCEDGGQKRDFIFVADCVDIVLWLLETPEVSGLFNVGTGEARSFADLAAATFGAIGQAPRIEYFDMPAEIRERYQYFTEARVDRLRAAGYDKPFTTLEDGVARYVGDHLAADDPYV